MRIKRALNKESSHQISLNLDEKCSRGISYSSQIVFLQSLHYTCFSSAVCPLQVPGMDACPVILGLKILSRLVILDLAFCLFKFISLGPHMAENLYF